VAQPGCTDPQATNYDEMATFNNGSCLYPFTEVELDLVAELPASLDEASGITHTSNSGLWAHNDGGNENEIYEIDSLTGAVNHTALIIGDNVDWEDMAESDAHIFLGDFGNNPGNRIDLKIYRLNKSELGNNIMNTEVIEFTYSDQTDFSENWNNHDFDCEAFIYYNDSLHLFTKNWANNQTRHYVLPAEPGSHIAQLRETFDVDGLITGADVSVDGTIILLGYENGGAFFNFFWLLFDYSEEHFFGGNRRRINLGTPLTNSQTEGIAFKNKYEGYVCSEQYDLAGGFDLPPKLLAFSIEEFLDNSTSIDEVFATSITVYPNPFTDALVISFSERLPESAECILVDALGNRVWSQNQLLDQQIKLTGFGQLASGFYTLIVNTDEGTAYKKVVKH